MPVPKRNETILLRLSVEHSQAEALSAALVTEAECTNENGHLRIFLDSHSFNDLRARWNTVMRGLIASEQSLGATRGRGSD